MTRVLALQAAVPRSPRGLDGLTRWRYVGEDTAWRVAAERGPLAGIPRVDQGERLSELAQELRSPYIDWIGELSVANASPQWWASDLAAKNPFTWLYGRICALAAALEALEEDTTAGTLVVCSSSAMVAELRDAAARRGLPARVAFDRSRTRAAAGERGMRFAVRLLDAWGRVAPRGVRTRPGRLTPTLRLALELTPSHRRHTLAELGAPRDGDFGGEDTALLVSWVDGRSFGPDGSYRDPHLGPLAGLLRERGLRVALLPRVLPTADFGQTARALLATGERAFLPDAWLTRADWRACARDASAFAPRIPPEATLSGVPVTRLAHEHVSEMRRAHVDAMIMRPLVARLAEGGVRPARIVFPWEGHAWEQALVGAVHEHMPGTAVVGYDNVNFSRLALSLYPARSEIGLRPLPDRVVTNGPTFTRILTGEGFPPAAVRTGCALRHAGLLDAAPPDGVRPAGTPFRVLAATSIDIGQSIELIEKALAAFGGDPRYEVAIKCHPALDVAQVRSQVRGLREAGNARFVEAPISELLESTDVMLYAYSVVCYEALARGIPAVFVQAETFLDLDQLEPFSQLQRPARSPEELRAHAEEIAGWGVEERAAWAERAQLAVAEALAPVESGCVDAFLSTTD